MQTRININMTKSLLLRPFYLSGLVSVSAFSSLQALAQSDTSLPPVTVNASRDSTKLPLAATVQAEREKLAQVPGGTNLAEPQNLARFQRRFGSDSLAIDEGSVG